MTPDELASPPDEATEASRPRRVVGPFTLTHVLALVATLAGAVALLALLSLPIAGPSPATAPLPGTGFYRIGDETEGLAVGQRPPPLAIDAGPILDLHGDPVELEDYPGRPVWVVFWASWCPPCQQETPDLQRSFEANEATGLELIGVNVQEPADVAAGYAETYGLTYRIALDPTAGAFRRWGVFGLPTHYFIGRDGRIRDRWFGPLSLAEMQRRVDLITEG